MVNQLIEIVGLFLLVVGAGAVVGAAAMVSVPLAVLTAGLFVILAGIVAVYIAAALDKALDTKAANAKAEQQ